MRPKTKILTITHDQSLVTLLQKELNDGDYEIVCCEHTGIALKDVVDAECPEFIILDIIMPSLDGIGICLQLRQWTQTPIMMLSTWDTSNNMVRGLNLGSDSYLTEPFEIATLKLRIEDTLKRTTVEPLRQFQVSNN
ncbi:MAG: response regulator transcription factor [Dehalococcoidales bacterium]